jgi:hypothetical protein
MKPRLSKILKKAPSLNLALILARDGEPNDKSLGILVSNHKSLADALIAELTLQDEDKHARTRLVELKNPMEPGSLIDPATHLKPQKVEH